MGSWCIFMCSLHRLSVSLPVSVSACPHIASESVINYLVASEYVSVSPCLQVAGQSVMCCSQVAGEPVLCSPFPQLLVSLSLVHRLLVSL